MTHRQFPNPNRPTNEGELLAELATLVFAAILEAREDGEDEVLIIDERLQSLLEGALCDWVLTIFHEQSALGEAALRVSRRRPLNGGPRGLFYDNERDDLLAAWRERMARATYDFSGVTGGAARQESIAKLMFGDIDLSKFVRPGTTPQFFKQDDPPDPPTPPEDL